MSKRYLGYETATSTTQVVRYLTQNYRGVGDGQWMSETIAEQIVAASAEDIDRGIRVFRSNVEYLGDEAVKKFGPEGEGYEFIEPDEEDLYEDEDDDE